MIAVTRILTVQERRERDIVFLKMMKILMNSQKGPANLITMLKTTISVTRQKVQNQWRQPMKMVLVRNPQIKVNKNWLASFFVLIIIGKKLRLKFDALIICSSNSVE